MKPFVGNGHPVRDGQEIAELRASKAEPRYESSRSRFAGLRQT
jgi:hypothetical protein